MEAIFIVIGLFATLCAIGVLASVRYGAVETALLTTQGGGGGWGQR
jgi:hypothetical protein